MHRTRVAVTWDKAIVHTCPMFPSYDTSVIWSSAGIFALSFGVVFASQHQPSSHALERFVEGFCVEYGRS